LSLDDVIALDKVQKKIPISETEVQHLRDLKLVAGIASELQVAGNYVKISYQDYKQMILDLIVQNGSTTRDDIVAMIMPTLSPDILIEKRQKKISNIIVEISTKDKKIVNISNSIKSPVWALVQGNNKNSNKNESSNKNNYHVMFSFREFPKLQTLLFILRKRTFTQRIS
jgi:ATP-dependent DNA helicase RecG